MLRLTWESVSQCNRYTMYKTFRGTRLFQHDTKTFKSAWQSFSNWPKSKSLLHCNQSQVLIQKRKWNHQCSRPLLQFKAQRCGAGPSLCGSGWSSGRWPAPCLGSAYGNGHDLAPVPPRVLYEMPAGQTARSAWRGRGPEERIAPFSGC